MVILEAKIMLQNPQLTIAEISDELHFPNQSFFGKFFKNYTELSPLQYKKIVNA
jgi:AraC family transcriptional regulator, transcriptional activator of pobA